MASHPPPNDVTPDGVAPAGLSQVGGRSTCSASPPPPWRPLATVDLPQPDRPGHLLSRTRVAPRLETTKRDGPAVWASLPNESAWPARLAPDAPCRAASRARSRKKARAAAPEVPSTPETPLRGAALLARPSGAGRSTDAFSTVCRNDPDWGPLGARLAHRGIETRGPFPGQAQRPRGFLRLEQLVG